MGGGAAAVQEGGDVGVAIYQLRTNGQINQAAALSVMTIILIIIMNNIVKFITRDRRKY